MTRHRAARTLPSNDAVARAWRQEDGGPLFDATETLLKAGAFGIDRLNAIASRFDHVEGSALRAESLRQAAGTEKDRGDYDGGDWGIEIFAIPVFGPGDSIESFATDPQARARVGRALATNGLISPQAQVSLLWGAWSLDDLAKLSPQTLRNAADEAADRMDAGGDAGHTPLKALEGAYTAFAGAAETGAIVLAILADEEDWEEGMGSPLHALLEEMDGIIGWNEEACADPDGAWVALWDAHGPADLSGLPPAPMDFAGAAIVEACLQAKVYENGTSSDVSLDYAIRPDDRGGVRVEALCGGQTVGAVTVGPRLFETFAEQLVAYFEPDQAEWDDEDDEGYGGYGDDGIMDGDDEGGLEAGDEDDAPAPPRTPRALFAKPTDGASPQAMRNFLESFTPPKGRKAH